MSLHCLSAFSSFTTTWDSFSVAPWQGLVFIAFRHLVHSRQELMRSDLCREEQLGLHCLSAFSSFTTPLRVASLPSAPQSLHCLSAFSSFTTAADWRTSVLATVGLHCLSAFSSFTTDLDVDPAICGRFRWGVFIAFRHLVHSRPAQTFGELNAEGQ
ncbi:MAG: hypothetical protein M2R45_03557 [Verrucomicrobia subdivision 3 bacterium]|nr:hypothetical protein [Limisphaerales bacterium]MCS1416466.1 hypothetical protein [Limisphaerales bacterium]